MVIHVCSIIHWGHISIPFYPQLVFQSKENYRDEQILGAYFDEGRLARQMYTHPGWATIAQKAARNYKQLEKESGKRISLFSRKYLMLYRPNQWIVVREIFQSLAVYNSVAVQFTCAFSLCSGNTPPILT